MRIQKMNIIGKGITAGTGTKTAGTGDNRKTPEPGRKAGRLQEKMKISRRSLRIKG